VCTLRQFARSVEERGRPYNRGERKNGTGKERERQEGETRREREKALSHATAFEQTRTATKAATGMEGRGGETKTRKQDEGKKNKGKETWREEREERVQFNGRTKARDSSPRRLSPRSRMSSFHQATQVLFLCRCCFCSFFNVPLLPVQ
jgi:hypothetical protein